VDSRGVVLHVQLVGKLLEVLEIALAAARALAVGAAVCTHLKQAQVEADLDPRLPLAVLDNPDVELSGLVGPTAQDGGDVLAHGGRIPACAARRGRPPCCPPSESLA